MSTSRLTKNHIFGPILDGDIFHIQFCGHSGLHHGVENVLPQGVKIDSDILRIGQRHSAAFLQGDGGGQLGGLGQGDSSFGVGQTDLIAAVLIGSQGGVGILINAGIPGFKTKNRTPVPLLRASPVFSLAIILPLQASGIHVLGIGHQGLTEDFLNLIFRGIARNDSGAILELRLGLHFGLHSGHIFGVLGGEGRQRHALGQHQGSQHAGHALTEPLLFLHDLASSLSFHSFSDRYLRLKKGKIPSVFPES